MSVISWESPYGAISKEIIAEGTWGIKPYDNSECRIQIIIKDCPEVLVKYNNSVLVVGDNDSDLGRILDSCLISMHERETATFNCNSLKFTLTLEKLHFKGFIFDWSAAEKYGYALHHKDKGVEQFKHNQLKNAAYRFTKGLKVLSSIPIDVEEPPSEINGVKIKAISALKANLFNNLASCYLRSKNWSDVIVCCGKVIGFDADNVKANYKVGVAFMEEKNYEEAEKSLEKVLKLEPENAVAKGHLKVVRARLKDENAKIDSIVKKMFSNNK